MKALLFLLFLAAPARAETIFDRMVGVFGSTQSEEFYCSRNPSSLSFSADRSRATFTFLRPAKIYNGSIVASVSYTVIGSDDDSITMTLDGEERRTDAGEQVVWVLHPIDRPDGFCWGRTDWDPKACVGREVRCPGAPGIS
jgi:hypothetical protein